MLTEWVNRSSSHHISCFCTMWDTSPVLHTTEMETNGFLRVETIHCTSNMMACK